MVQSVEEGDGGVDMQEWQLAVRWVGLDSIGGEG